MKSLNNIRSKWIISIAVLFAAAAVNLAFQAQVGANISAAPVAKITAPEIVIIGEKMTAKEKRAYDLQPQEVARVEIVGKRLSTVEKMVMAVKDEMAANPNFISSKG